MTASRGDTDPEVQPVADEPGGEDGEPTRERPILPYGSWPSPIGADLVAGGTIRLSEPRVDGDRILWIEGRPAEGGRRVLVAHEADGTTRDLVPPPFDVRTRVHEYGGGSYVADGGTVWFVDFAEQRLCRLDPDGTIAVVAGGDGRRHADVVVDRRRGLLLAVEEDHRGTGPPVDRLVAIPTEGGEPRVLVEGADFYAAPRLSPDGTRLCWLSWNHPDMPWDATELWLAELTADGRLERPRCLVGASEESLLEPSWSPSGELLCLSDRSGFWNLYRVEVPSSTKEPAGLAPVWSVDADCTDPPWLLGYQSYTVLDDGRIVCLARLGGATRLCIVAGTEVERLDLPFTEIGPWVRRRAAEIVLVAAGPLHPTAIVAVDTATRRVRTLRQSIEVAVSPGYVSVPVHVEVPTTDGQVTHAHVYAPRNDAVAAPAGERPPLLVRCHGGPTAAASTALDWEIQFWTSRGFAVADVDYRGSSGYGRAYRRALDGRWGIVDVDDCEAVARWLAKRGEVDGRRLLIDGGSAGGYTTLCALVRGDVFAAGTSYYGVADLEMLARDTHKFESHYLDRLVGPYPERRDLYLERSPLHHADRIRRPVLLLQGAEDPIVPLNQAEAMIAALRARGVPCALLVFPGEYHGFRRAETIRRALEAELSFLAQVLGFAVADPIQPVAIENLSR